MELNDSRFLVPPDGAVLRFEDICVQRTVKSGKSEPMSPVLTHVTGTFLPNQITAVIGSEHKSAFMHVLAGYEVKNDYLVSGHIFLNGSPVSGSLVASGLASFLSKDV